MTPLEITLLVLVITEAIIILAVVGAYLAAASKSVAAMESQKACMEEVTQIRIEYMEKLKILNKGVDEYKLKKDIKITEQQLLINQLMDKLGNR